MRARGIAYGWALGLVAVVIGARALLAPTLGSQALYLFLVPSVLIAGILGGWGPGLVATFLSLALHLYLTGEFQNLIDPNSSLFAAELSRAVTFTLLGIGIAWFGERLRRAQRDSVTNTEGLRLREAHLQSILDTVPDAMIVIDERGIIQSFSTAAARLFGYTSTDVVGTNIKSLMPSPYRENHDGYL